MGGIWNWITGQRAGLKKVAEDAQAKLASARSSEVIAQKSVNVIVQERSGLEAGLKGAEAAAGDANWQSLTKGATAVMFIIGAVSLGYKVYQFGYDCYVQHQNKQTCVKMKESLD